MSSESLSDALSEFSDDPVMDLDGNIIEEEQTEEPQEAARDNGVEEFNESDDFHDDAYELLREMQEVALRLEHTIRQPASRRHRRLVRLLIWYDKQ